MGFENPGKGSNPEKSSANTANPLKQPDPKKIGQVAVGGAIKK